MSAPSGNCPDCGIAFEYWQAHCRNGHLVGFPNYRAAEAERVELSARFQAAGDNARNRGLASLLAKLDTLAQSSQPVIVMSFAACDNILRSDKYRNYDKRLESGERNPAEARDHADRQMVAARLFPVYGAHIHYAALSPNGRGLTTYGEGSIGVRWQVTPHYLGARASLLEENSFMFYDHHGLGTRGAVPPAGYQATWEDRAKLVVAKLAPRLTPATSEASLPDLLLHTGKESPGR